MTNNGPEYFHVIAGFIPEDQKNILLKAALRHNAQSPEHVKFFLSGLSQEQAQTLIEEKDEYGLTLLYDVAKSAELLKMILDCYSEEQRPSAIIRSLEESKDDILGTQDMAALFMIFELIPPAKRLYFFKKSSFLQKDGLTNVLKSPELLEKLLSFIPDEQFEEFVALRGTYNLSILDLVEDDYPQSMPVITQMRAAITTRRETLPSVSVKENNLLFFHLLLRPRQPREMNKEKSNKTCLREKAEAIGNLWDDVHL